MNFSVAQGISGTIPSLSISNVPFKTALGSLLKTAGLVYRIENGVYMISKKPEVTLPASSGEVALPGAAPIAIAGIDDTTVVESTIDRVILSNTGASQMLSIMSGSSQQYGGGYGGGMMMGGYSGMGMMGGMSGGYGMPAMSGYGGGFGGISRGYNGYGTNSYRGSTGGYGGGVYGGGINSYGGVSSPSASSGGFVPVMMAR